MMRSTLALLVTAVLALASSGCATYPGTAREASRDDLLREEGWVLLDTVPDVRQVSRMGCGAACLSMVLGHWGRGTDPGALEEECAVPGIEGIRAASLRDAARRRGLSAFLLAGTTADLEHELARGRPVLVGLAKPDGDGYTAHFQVVVGMHTAGRRIAVLDPAVGLMSDSLQGFEVEWRITKCVMLVAFPPEAVAASVDV